MLICCFYYDFFISTVAYCVCMCLSQEITFIFQMISFWNKKWFSNGIDLKKNCNSIFDVWELIERGFTKISCLKTKYKFFKQRLQLSPGFKNQYKLFIQWGVSQAHNITLSNRSQFCWKVYSGFCFVKTNVFNWQVAMLLLVVSQ